MNDMWGRPMNGFNNPNDFQRNIPNIPNGGYSYAPRYEVIKVNGEEGAKQFRMGPNSSALLLDENEPIVWFVQTDGAGYCVPTPYDITPHKTIPPIDINQLAQRLAQLEETVNARQSNSQSNKQPKKQRIEQQQQPASDTTN